MAKWMTVAMGLMALTACGALNCTEMGCQGSFEVTLADLGAETTGELELAAAFSDDNQASCTLELSDSANSGCYEAVWSGDDLVLTLFLPMGASGDSVDLTVTLDDDVVHDETLTELDWSEPYYPNGEACDAGFGCSSVSVLVDLSGAVSE